MIKTFSTFYFGIPEIDITTRNIPFREGAGPELNAVLDVGAFTLESIVTAIQIALDAASVTLIFTVSVDRAERKITIAADGAFDLLIDTGVTAQSSIFSTIGFTGSIDLTGLTTYTADSATGKEYKPQFRLQSFVDKDNFQEAADASVNITVNGAAEVLSFGDVLLYELDIMFISSNTAIADCVNILPNPTGLEDAQEFMRDITKRKPFEFMKDVNDKNTFDKVQLDKIPGSPTATGFKLIEMIDDNVPDIFSTGILTLRVVA